MSLNLHVIGATRPFCARAYTTASTASIQPTKLVFTKFAAPSSPSRPPFVICHSFLGSKQNWKTLAKAMSQQFNTDVYTLDARNHGDSPHAEPHTYEAMALDLKHWMQEHGMEKPTVIGHSMGGKTAMTFALQHPELLSNLIVLDIAPLKLRLLHDFDNYCAGMLDIEQRQLTRLEQASAIMARYEPDVHTRNFLLTNLKKSRDDGVYRFRVPLHTVTGALGNMGDFIQNHKYLGPTLFILGGASPYRRPFMSHSELIDMQFPNSTTRVVPNATHWLHNEYPDIVMSMMNEFLALLDKPSSS
ncbi:Alpha/Beta hydrolase protein [Gongronella butleri]|nr:Alpha/Beta hydrolase protein [Gongronella butleri]